MNVTGSGRVAIARMLAGLVVVAMVAGACGNDSPQDKAQGVLDEGLAAHVAGKYEEALTKYNDVLRLDARNKFAYYNIGQIAQTVQNDAVAAENNYRLALSIDPNYSPALFNLAIIRNNAGDPTEAEKLYRRVVEIDPGNAGAFLNLGLLLQRTKREKEGKAFVEKALELNPDLAERLKPPSKSPSPNPAASPTATGK